MSQCLFDRVIKSENESWNLSDDLGVSLVVPSCGNFARRSRPLTLMLLISHFSVLVFGPSCSFVSSFCCWQCLSEFSQPVTSGFITSTTTAAVLTNAEFESATTSQSRKFWKVILLRLFLCVKFDLNRAACAFALDASQSQAYWPGLLQKKTKPFCQFVYRHLFINHSEVDFGRHQYVHMPFNHQWACRTDTRGV